MPVQTVMNANYEGDRALKERFPDAFIATQVVDCASKFLLKEGFKEEKTRLLHSTCPDEINGLMDSQVSRWGPPFHMGGLAGMPFAGKTGFGALASHVPDDGMIFCVYGPHVGQDAKGQFGTVPRQGMANCSSACGAAIGAFKALSKCGNREELVGEMLKNPMDMQMALVTKCVNDKFDSIANTEDPMTALVDELYAQIHDQIVNHIVPKDLKYSIAFLGGIQVNTPPGSRDYFVVKDFLVTHPNKGTNDLKAPLIDSLRAFDASHADSAL